MPSESITRFTEALQKAEEARDPSGLIEMFTDDAELQNLSNKTPVTGHEAARKFWADYLGAFEQIHSQFTHIFEGEGCASLEWTATGKLSAGKEITYRGISILEMEGAHIRNFRTYYDTSPFISKTPAGQNS